MNSKFCDIYKVAYTPKSYDQILLCFLLESLVLCIHMEFLYCVRSMVTIHIYFFHMARQVFEGPLMNNLFN